jgi:hypothetical protein
MKRVLFLSLIYLTMLFLGCEKDEGPLNSCFDEELYQKNKNNYCPMDCPGVIGCDDKIYCNECVATKQGIRVKN